MSFYIFIKFSPGFIGWAIRWKKKGWREKGWSWKVNTRLDLHPGWGAQRVWRWRTLIINRRSAHQYDQFAVDDSSRTEVLGAWSACSNSSFDCYRNYWPAAAAKAKSACKAIWPWQSSFSSTPSLAVELITSSAPSFVTSSFQPHFRAIVCSLKNEPN